MDAKLAPKKAPRGVKVVKFLGQRVSAEGLASDAGKVEALLKMPMPTNNGQLRSLMGAVSYYRKFLPKMAAETKSRRVAEKRRAI